MIIIKVNVVGKVVIIVINMFEIMIDKLCVICLEVFDVFNVVIDGIDVIMFLGELVNGKYLVELVCIMVIIDKNV